MNVKTIISQIMKNKDITTIALSEKLGYNYPSGVTERLRGKKGIRDDVIVKFLEAMNCELIIRDKESKQEWTVTVDEVKEELEKPSPRTKSKKTPKKKVDLDDLLKDE